jgi:hypothetical protein
MLLDMHTYLFLFCNPCIPVSGSSSSVSLSIMKAAYAAEAPPAFGGCFRFTLEHASKNMYMQLNIRTFVYSLSLSLYLYLSSRVNTYTNMFYTSAPIQMTTRPPYKHTCHVHMPVHMRTYLLLFCKPCTPVSGFSSSVSFSRTKA